MAQLTRNAIISALVSCLSGKCSRYLLLYIGLIILTACGSSPGQGTEEIRIVGKRVDVNMEDPGKSGEYVYDPAELTFERDEQVTLVMTSEGEFHTFTVEELEIDVHVDAWKSKALTYTFDRPGTYRLVCIPHETLGMTGVINVR
jgi:plastocyanin